MLNYYQSSVLSNYMGIFTLYEPETAI